jgi:hypothetical protein
MDNPNAAFCFGNMQIEGLPDRGTPQDPNNAELMELYKEKQLRYYDYVLNDERWRSFYSKSSALHIIRRKPSY